MEEDTSGTGLGCTICTGGEQCNARGLVAQQGDETNCAAGFFCPNSDERYACDVGYYCPINSKVQIKCADGEY